ncbi:hypothetical protein LCGC14_0717790 [marine sediment metagenome]|uniref:Uncharacterized protein n=1 Tax=marine sediment metagenome TaxID=412755 RepID=A0A0F9QD98_9ZZZZ
MKRAALYVSPQFWGSMLKQDEMHVKIENPLPDDAKYIETRYDMDRGLLYMIFESEEFEDITDKGAMIPEIPPIMFTEVT